MSSSNLTYEYKPNNWSKVVKKYLYTHDDSSIIHSS